MTKFHIRILCQSDDSCAQFFEVYGKTGAERYERTINKSLDHELFYTELIEAPGYRSQYQEQRP